MKNLLSTVFICILTSVLASAQSLDLDLVANTHNGGYHISCFGLSDATITSVVTGGEAPYSYSWSSGETTPDLENTGAGSHTLTVTDNLGASISASIEITEPHKLLVSLDPAEYSGGVHISEPGANDGVIATETSGGTPPYTYLWSDGSTSMVLKNVPAGTYSVTVTDANECTHSASVTLVEPTPLSLSLNAPNHGGIWSLSCFNSNDGSIDATVTGGIEPYTFNWSHGAFSEDVEDLRAGEYTLRVEDANRVTVSSTIVLTQPDEIDLTCALLEYPNEHHVSCHDCFNGSATLTTTGGAGSFTYEWEDGNTQSSRNDLGLEAYRLQVSDANGCVKEKTIELRIPTRDDWTMSGNAVQAGQFIGSTNETDVEFRANGQLQLRLGGDGVTELLGGVKTDALLDISENAVPGARFLVVDEFGNLAKLGDDFPEFPFAPTIPPCLETINGNMPWWDNGPGKIFTVCEPVNVGIGINDPEFKLDVDGTIQGEDLRLSSGSSLVRLGADGVFKNGAWGPGEESALFIGDENHHIRSKWGDANEVGGLRLGVAGMENALTIDDWSGKVRAEKLHVGGGEYGGSLGGSARKLSVNGTIVAKEVYVSVDYWSDFVFKEDYDLRPLSEVGEFIDQNGHLPDVPSETEVLENGNPLGSMDAILLQKIEELTLYLLEVQKQVDELKAENQSLRSNDR